jgi:hypothetical protein
MILLVIALFLVLAFYLLPTIMVIKRKNPNAVAVVILNLFLGFTFIGWIFALVLATRQPQPVVVYNSPSPPHANASGRPIQIIARRPFFKQQMRHGQRL